MRRLRWGLALFMTCCLVARAAPSPDQAALLAGVKAIAAPGVPGPICVFGPQAFAVVTAPVSSGVRGAVVAAARCGQGRVVAFGHGGYFDAEALRSLDTGRLVVNAVQWAGRSPSPRVGVCRLPALSRLLAAQGCRVIELADGAPDGPDVVVCDPMALRDAEVAPLQAWVRQGGGLVVAGLGWGWLQLNPGLTLDHDHRGNRLIAVAGLCWADGTLERTRPDGYNVTGEGSPYVNAQAALDLLSRPSIPDAGVAQASFTLTQAVGSVPTDDRLLLPRIDALRGRFRDLPVPSEAHPLTLSRDAIPRVLVALEAARRAHLPPDRVKASRAAAAFPGTVPPAAPRVSVDLRIDTSESGWHGTGVYAAPGEVVTVTVLDATRGTPAASAGNRLRVRIGAHTDLLWDVDGWKRIPEISMSVPLRQGETRVASAFGGLVYIEVAEGSKGPVDVRIDGAVAAPRFVLGTPADKPSASAGEADWKTARLAPAPWAELEGKRVIITVPSAVVRKLDDPTALMRFWDAVADACADLAALPHARNPRLRYVADVQISEGYMHSGYPIMTHLDVAPMMVDIAQLKTENAWGLYHEMGHNHQSDSWTFEGSVEVTCNLFTRYVLETMCGLAPRAQKTTGAPRLRGYLAAGAPFARWKDDPFLALLMFDQIQQAFGWTPFKQVFAHLHGLNEAERPRSNADKRDLWMLSLSRAVGRNLGPFFTAWGVPTSARARAQVAALPRWMPRELQRAAGSSR